MTKEELKDSLGSFAAIVLILVLAAIVMTNQ